MSKKCYAPDGTDMNAGREPGQETYLPCTNGSAVSMCCEKVYGDTCAPHGICHNFGILETWWRKACTDPTWQDPACIKLFVNGTGFDNQTLIYDHTGNPTYNAGLTLCSDDSYCYGWQNNECCNQQQGVFIVNGTQTNVNPNPVTSASVSASRSTSAISATTVTSLSTVTVSTTPSSTSTNSTGVPSSPNALSAGTKAGIGIGAACGGLVFVAVLWLAIRRSRSQPQYQTWRITDPMRFWRTRSTEVPARLPRSEIDGKGIRQKNFSPTELPLHP